MRPASTMRHRSRDINYAGENKETEKMNKYIHTTYIHN
jgi:hypothetical protein